MIRIAFFSFLILSLTACSPKIQDAGTDYFSQANTLKEETEQIQQGFKEAIQNLRSQRNSIMVQGRALTEQELSFIDEVNAILELQGKLQTFQDDITKSEEAYEPNGKELLYLNEQANNLAKEIQQKTRKLTKKSDE